MISSTDSNDLMKRIFENDALVVSFRVSVDIIRRRMTGWVTSHIRSTFLINSNITKPIEFLVQTVTIEIGAR
jgi:hypothetical protein